MFVWFQVLWNCILLQRYSIKCNQGSLLCRTYQVYCNREVKPSNNSQNFSEYFENQAEEFNLINKTHPSYDLR